MSAKSLTFPSQWVRFAIACAAILGFVLGLGKDGHAQYVTVTLKNGMTISPVSGRVVDSFPRKGQTPSGPMAPNIAEMDDGLRITYVDNGLVQGEARANVPIKITFANNAKRAVSGAGTKTVGVFSAASLSLPFDVLGRRFYRFDNGELLVQGITSITPQYIQLESFRSVEAAPIQWDMRMSIDSIPAAKLREVLLKNADPTRAQTYLDIVGFYRASSRFIEAREVLAYTLQLFPEEEAEFKPVLKQLEQLAADQLFGIAQKAKKVAGQHEFAKQVLESFDPNALTLETGLQVKQQRDQMEKEAADRAKWIAAMKEDIGLLKDLAAQKDCLEVVDEIERFLTADTFSRFADYVRLRDSSKTEQRVALAIGSWLYGLGASEENLAVVLSGIRAKKLVQQYLSAPTPNDASLEELTKLESGTPRYVSRIVANMAPPMPPKDENLLPVSYVPDPTQPDVVAQTKVAGRYLIEVPLPREMAGSKATYVVQLPPEYNPYRRYPCIVTMNGQVSTPEDQLNWWCGYIDPKTGRGWGEASKNGYIVIAPYWMMPKQPGYNYTENEHMYVLASLIDAKRRFSIDNNRVFISGHHNGADGAWDIALAHPDLWAGSVIVGGVAAKYVIQYLPNSEYVPQYFVTGELAAKGPTPHTDLNGMVWDKILKNRRYDVMISIYRGRGFDHFLEELPRVFEWLNLPNHVRNFNRQEFSVKTSRFGDRFFWWFETDQLKDGPNVVHPLMYEADKEHRVESTINKNPNNVISFKYVPAERFSIWLTPEMIDFGRNIEVKTNATSKRFEPKPETRVLLQDVRARGDRQHPFWMKINFPN
jgi:hypothetical protein